MDGAGHTYDPWLDSPQDPEIDRDVRDIDENERSGMRRLLMFSIVTLLLAGCTQVDAGDAKDDLESSRAQVDQEIVALAKRLSDAFGGSPKIIKRRYLSCGSAPTEALQYTATSEAKTPEQVVVSEVREVLVEEGWKATDSRPARGVSPETLFIKREDRRVAVGIKDATLTVGANGDCIRVTSEQANKLSGPID